MTISFRPAKRENVPLLIGLAGGTGSGKTYSAMRLAKGLAAGARFAVIDTENGRARHYADLFEFDCADLTAPFRPDAYADAIVAADEAGYPVIVVDSASHEHAGEGGLLDWHEEEFQRMGGRDAVKVTAWIKPKQSHKAMVNRLLQVRAHVILCFRAEQKIEMVKGADGKMEVRAKKSLTGLDGWIPICEKTLPYELTISCLLVADHPGVPHPIKLQEQHRGFVSVTAPLDEKAGKALAKWSAGGESKPEPVAQAAVPAELTEAQSKKLDLLVGTLRDAEKITTEQVAAAVAKIRQQDVGEMIEALDLRDDEGTLRWSRLRAHLTKAEGSSLIERLGTLEKNVGAAA